jgi:hypothetical protein
VTGLTGVTQVAAGTFHSLAVRSDGTVWAWGANNGGQLGDGTTTNRSVPVQVTGLTGVTQVAAGTFHSLAVRSDGTVWAWGNNLHGQLGDGTTTNRSVPVQVTGLSGVTQVAAGWGQSLAVKSDGTVWAWGYNLQGELGDGTTTDSPVPVPVAGLSGVVQVAATGGIGGGESLAVKSDGTVWAWGIHIGSVPVQVAGLSGVTQLAAGVGGHILALAPALSDSDLALAGMPVILPTAATSPAGAVVTYTPPIAVDEDGPATASVSCSQPSGSTFPEGTTRVTCTATDTDDTDSPSVWFDVTVTEPIYQAVTTPVRVTDTRTGSGFPNAGRTVGPGATLNVKVGGIGGVPATGVTTVVLNVTATRPTQASFLTLWPTGTGRPVTSNLNFVAGQTVANLVQVAASASGQVSIYNRAGSVDVVVDVQGYYEDVDPALYSGGVPGLYQSRTPIRFADTRSGSGYSQAGQRLGPGATLDVGIGFPSGVYLPGVTAVVLNVTVTGPTQASYLTVWQSGSTRPATSNLNFVAGQTVANRLIVPIGGRIHPPSPLGYVSIYNHAGSVDVIVDASGYFYGGSQFWPLTPGRITDTRPGSGYPNAGQTLGPGTTLAVQVGGAGGVPASGVTAVVLNVTVTGPGQASYLTVWEAGTVRPETSDLNWVAGQTVANLVVTTVGTNGQILIYNNAGSVNVIVDVSGWYG